MLSRKAQREYKAIRQEYSQLTLVDAFKPNKGGQEEFFQSKKHQIILAGGNKAGKTYCGLMKVAYRSLPEKDKYGKQTGWVLDPYVRSRIPAKGVEGWISTESQPVQMRTVQETFDRIFNPYIVKGYTERGAHAWKQTEVALIHFICQQSRAESYVGANLDFAYLDEPHDRLIYYETVSRLAKTKGYMWNCLTPILDAADPDAMKKMHRISWMRKELVEPFEREADAVPELDVIYVNIDENPHIDKKFIMDMWSSLSPEEKLIRESGKFFDFIGETPFDSGQLNVLYTYLRTHPEVSQPQYGILELDEGETDDDFTVTFTQTTPNFPELPRDKWIWKIWQHPVADQLGIIPDYYIGCDAASGKTTGDYTSAYVCREDTGEMVAGLHGHLDEIELAKQLWLAGNYYCNKIVDTNGSVIDRRPAKLAIETVNIGKVALSYLITGHDELGIPKYSKRSLYRQPEVNNIALGRNISGTDYGWYTSSKTRPYLVTVMRQALSSTVSGIQNKGVILIKDKGWVEEAKKFILNPQGKFEAASGYTDDRLFGMAICQKAMESYRKFRPPAKVIEIDNKDSFIYDETGNIMWNIEGIKAAARKHKKAVVF